MPRTYEQLLSNDSAWPELAAKIAASKNRVTALAPSSDAARRACLLGVGVTTKSVLGAIAHETGGILIDGGWIRLLGAGSTRLPRVLGGYNLELDVPMSAFLIVADDVVGGVFAINAGALGPSIGHVYYFAPDALDWEDTGLGHADFVSWTLEGNLDKYYATQRWTNWRAEVEQLPGDQAISMFPFLWTREGQIDVDKNSRKAVPCKELWTMQEDSAQALGGI
jgi:hypothetical protein